MSEWKLTSAAGVCEVWWNPLSRHLYLICDDLHFELLELKYTTCV